MPPDTHSNKSSRDKAVEEATYRLGIFFGVLFGGVGHAVAGWVGVAVYSVVVLVFMLGGMVRAVYREVHDA